MHQSPDPSSCPAPEKINRDILLTVLAELAVTNTMRETQVVLAEVYGMAVTYENLKKIAQRHGIQFRRAAKGGTRPGAGRPRGRSSAERPHGYSWAMGDYAGLSVADMPPVPYQASKKTGLARYDMAWVLRVGSRLGPSEGPPDGADTSARGSRADKISAGVRFSGIRRS